MAKRRNHDENLSRNEARKQIHNCCDNALLPWGSDHGMDNYPTPYRRRRQKFRRSAVLRQVLFDDCGVLISISSSILLLAYAFHLIVDRPRKQDS